jgi:high affinity sulfate transporter 1
MVAASSDVRPRFTTRLKTALPIVQWLPSYRSEWLRPDVVAGITLAAYGIPVAVAYSSLAGLPPEAGLYCYLLGGIAYALFGTSRQLAIGPTSAISILIGSAIGTMAAGDIQRQGHLAAGVGILAGVIGLICWLLRLGNLANFVSETILSGFKVGAGLVIASTQLPKLFGIASGGDNFFQRIVQLVKHLPETHLPTLMVGVGALLLLILGERFLPSRPIALFVVAISIAVMTWVPLASHGVKIVGAIPQGLPSLGWPLVQWNEVDNLLGLALACFLLSYVESISTVRTFAVKHGYPIDADQELLALGAANFAAGFGGGYPLAGGMSQSAVNEKGGARSQLSLVFASVTIAIVLLFLTGLMSNLPQAVLAAIVLMAIQGLINPRELRHLYRISKMEFRIAMVATVGVLAFGILKGVLLAAIFSILLLLKRASNPHVADLGRLPGTDRFVDITRAPEAELLTNVLALRIESPMLYFNVENVRKEILGRVASVSAIRIIVLDLSSSPGIDLAGVRMLGQLHKELQTTGVAFRLAGVHGSVRDLLQLEKLDGIIEGAASRVDVAESVKARVEA